MPPSELIQHALEARKNAYAPYSGYRVGAAVQCSDGRVFSASNVENVSYGLTMCAERSAVFAMVAAGGREVAEVAVATKDGGTPCGACLQVLLEFALDASAVDVHCSGENGTIVHFKLSELMPFGFRSPHVNRTEPGRN
jgi:cytidine deaminase